MLQEKLGYRCITDKRHNQKLTINYKTAQGLMLVITMLERVVKVLPKKYDLILHLDLCGKYSMSKCWQTREFGRV